VRSDITNNTFLRERCQRKIPKITGLLEENGSEFAAHRFAMLAIIFFLVRFFLVNL